MQYITILDIRRVQKTDTYFANFRLVVIIMVVTITIVITATWIPDHNFSLLLIIIVRHVDVEDTFVPLLLYLCEDAARTNEAAELQDVRNFFRRTD